MPPHALDIKTYKVEIIEESLGRWKVKKVKTVIKGKYMQMHTEPCKPL